MKKTKFLPILTLGVWMALSLSASGQYFNYASAHTGIRIFVKPVISINDNIALHHTKCWFEKSSCITY